MIVVIAVAVFEADAAEAAELVQRRLVHKPSGGTTNDQHL